jgi:hypothetical protein
MTLLSSTITNCAAPRTAIGSHAGGGLFVSAADTPASYGAILVLSNGRCSALSRMARSLST